MPAIVQPRSAGLQFPRLAMPATPQYPVFQAAPIPNFASALLSMPTAGERATAGIGQAVEGLRDASQQAGLQQVLQGGLYNQPASDNFTDRLAASIRHAFNGSLGKNGGPDGLQMTPYDRDLNGLPAEQNVTVGPDGRLAYDPNRALSLAGSRIGLQQGQNALEMSGLQLDEARRQARQREALLKANPFDSGTTIPVDPGTSRAEPVRPGPLTGGQPVGKVTDYGQADDPYKDSASLGTGKYTRPTGAWNNALSETSMAISPDIEAQFRAAGIKQGDPVRLQLSDGSTVVRTWDDRTMQDAQAVERFGKPLRGRFDFFSPAGPHPQRGVSVVGFEPATPGPLTGGPAPASEPPLPESVTGDPGPGPLTGNAAAAAKPAVGPGPLTGGAPQVAAAGPLTGGPEYPPTAEGIAKYVQEQGAPLEASGGPAAPRMSTATPKVQQPNTPAAQKAADQSVAAQSEANQITLMGRYGRDSRGELKFLTNAQLQAMGRPPGNETRQIPKFYTQALEDGSVVTMQRDPHGGKDTAVPGSLRSASQFSLERTLKKFDLPEEIGPELLAKAQSLGGVKASDKMVVMAQTLASAMKKKENEGKTPQEVLDSLSTASPQIQNALTRSYNLHPAVAQFIKTVVPNYDAIARTSEIPQEKRTLADDKAMVRQFIILTTPNKSPTNQDIADMKEISGLPQNVMASIRNLYGGKTSRLDDTTVAAIRATADREFASRRVDYELARDTFVQNAKRQGAAPAIFGPNIAEAMEQKRIEEHAKAQQAPAAKQATAPATPAAPAAPTPVRTAEEYNALPSGAAYVDPAGNVRKKP